eukprot:SAG25_NODE_3207_length_1174_cov_1.042791_1_plen_53_part_10
MLQAASDVTIIVTVMLGVQNALLRCLRAAPMAVAAVAGVVANESPPCGAPSSN